MPPPRPEPHTGPFSLLSTAAGLLASLALGYLALSQRLPAPPARASLGAPPAMAACVMDRDGYWRGRMTGATVLDLDWNGRGLDCAGNARPGDRGLRLFFSGPAGVHGERLLIVIGIDTAFARLAGAEHAVNLTLVDEASSQFFHAAGGRCFTRIHEVSALAGQDASYRVDGELYCAGAIAAINGASSIVVGDSRYSGRLTLAGE